MEGNTDPNYQKTKTSKQSLNFSQERHDGLTEVHILRKVLVPSPGYETRLYSVHIMSTAEAEDYCQNRDRRSKEDDFQARHESARSSVRVFGSGEEYWKGLDNKDFVHYKA